MSNVSIFPSSKNTKSGTIHDSASVVEMIRSGQWKYLVEQVNSLPFGTKEQEQLKQKLPGITWQGVFNTREINGIIEHSGLIACDFDHIGASEWDSYWSVLTACPHVYTLFRSPRRNGMKAIFRIPICDESTHRGYARGLRSYFEGYPKYDHYEDISRLCFVSYDPDIYFNPDAIEFTYIIPVEQATTDNHVDIVALPNDAMTEVFRKCIYSAEHTRGKHYVDGNKHNYLISVFTSSNKAGLPLTQAIDYTYDYCSRIRGVQSVCKDDFTNRATNIYTRYSDQFGKYPFRMSVAPSPVEHTNEDLPAPTKLTFPIEVFPTNVVNYINELNHCLNYSKDFLSIAVMWTLATINGNRYKLRVKNEWIAPTVFWFAVVGEPGTMKSHPINCMIDPIKILDRDSKLIYDEQYREYEDREFKGTKPKYKQILVSDFTLEALHTIHDINRRGIGLYKDELIGFLNDMNRYRKGSDEQFWLESFNNQSYIVNRVTREPILIVDTMINILGSIQPAVLSKLTRECAGNGMVDRFLFTTNETGIFPISKSDINKDWKTWWTKVIQSVNIQSYYTDAVDTEIIEMSGDALDLFLECDRNFCALQQSDNETNAIKNYISKMKTYLPRFALLMWLFDIHIVQYYEQIEYDHMDRARKICEYFIASAREVFNESESRKEIEDVNTKLSGKTKIEKIIALCMKGYRSADIARQLNTASSYVSKTLKDAGLVPNK